LSRRRCALCFACSAVTLPVWPSAHSAPLWLATLSLHDALPIFAHARIPPHGIGRVREPVQCRPRQPQQGKPEQRRHHGIVQVFRDRKSTRLNSSHVKTSYAVFCLKKKTTGYTRGRGRSWRRHSN